MFVNFMKSMMALFSIASGWSSGQHGDSIDLKSLWAKGHTGWRMGNVKNGADSSASGKRKFRHHNIDELSTNSDNLKQRKHDKCVQQGLELEITPQNYEEIDSDDENSDNMGSVTGDDINTSTSSNDSNKGILEEVEEELDSKSDSINNLVLPSDLTRAGENIFLSKRGLYEPTLYDVKSTLLSSKDAEEARELINCLKSFEHGDVIDLSYILSVAIEKFGAECIPVHVQQCVDSLYLKMGLSIPDSRFSEEEVIQIKLGGIYLATHVDQ